ncbi:MAG: hypothetical protein H6R18_346 [Proteobacteria bacterium]|nr:hypothetical protein [Pseudomonadota bacterium]
MQDEYSPGQNKCPSIPERISIIILTIDLLPMLMAIFYITKITIPEFAKWDDLFPISLLFIMVVVVIYGLIVLFIFVAYIPIIKWFFSAVIMGNVNNELHAKAAISSGMSIIYTIIVFQFSEKIIDKLALLSVGVVSVLFFVCFFSFAIWKKISSPFVPGTEGGKTKETDTEGSKTKVNETFNDYR